MWLHHKDSPKWEITTYALLELEEVSDTTFIKSEVLKNLGLKGPEVKLNLSTMLRQQEIAVEKISGLVVDRIDKRMEIELPKTYSRSNIPFRRDQIPRKETANEKPREVILGKGDPYAVRTLLGWGIIGPVIMPTSKEEADEVNDNSVTCNRVMAYERGSDCSRNIAFVTTSQTKEEISSKVIKMMFEADFSEKDRNSQALS